MTLTTGIRHLTAILAACWLLASAPLPALAQPTTQPVVVVVRDGAGNPLFGVPILIHLSGPPLEPFDQCVTDERGQCTLDLFPGSYTLQFVQGWRDKPFVPVEQQNAYQSEDGSAGGGFAANIRPANQVLYLTFVVGLDAAGYLVPLWDMSRDPSLPPQPYDPGGGALDGLSFEPFDPTLDLSGPGSLPPTGAGQAAGPTPTAQVFVDELGAGGAAPTQAATGLPVTAPPPDANPSDGLDAGLILTGLVALVVIIILGILFFLLLRHRAESPR